MQQVVALAMLSTDTSYKIVIFYATINRIGRDQVTSTIRWSN